MTRVCGDAVRAAGRDVPPGAGGEAGAPCRRRRAAGARLPLLSRAGSTGCISDWRTMDCSRAASRRALAQILYYVSIRVVGGKGRERSSCVEKGDVGMLFLFVDDRSVDPPGDSPPSRSLSLSPGARGNLYFLCVAMREARAARVSYAYDCTPRKRRPSRKRFRKLRIFLFFSYIVYGDSYIRYKSFFITSCARDASYESIGATGAMRRS